MIDIIPSAYAQMHGHMATGGSDVKLVKLQVLDVAARVATDLQNGALTVSWEPNEDTVITKTATWEWRTGELYLKKTCTPLMNQFDSHYMMQILWIHHADFFTYWMRVYSGY